MNSIQVPSAILASVALLSVHAIGGQAFSFAPAQTVTYPAPGLLQQLETLDMDGDGNPDVFVALSGNHFIYTGDGAGHLSATPVTVTETPNSYSPGGLLFYDVNGDGRSDEVYAYPGYSNSGITYPGVFAVMLGDGKGKFTQSTSISQPVFYGPGTPSIASGAFTHTGRLDFVTVYGDNSNPGHGVLNVYLNQGQGVFSSGLSLPLIGTPESPVTGDFNGDGSLDIAWFDALPETGTTNRFAAHCLYGNGDGTFSADKICYTFDGSPQAATTADFNHDGKTDLLVYANAKVGVAGAQPRIATLLAKQTGGFYWSSAVSVNTPNDDFRFGDRPFLLQDMNGDGYPDVVFVFFSSLFAGKANGVFGPRQQIITNGWFPPVYAPLRKGGLPDMIYSVNDDGDFCTKLWWQLNTSPK